MLKYLIISLKLFNKINVHKGPINVDVLAQHDIVVITDFYEKELLVEWN